MIANITTGEYTKGMILYNHNKTVSDGKKPTEAILLGTNAISNTNPNYIINTLIRQNLLNENISKPNLHISLNFHKKDILDNNEIFNIAKDYMKEMGYGDQPFAVYRHFDTGHPHIHIASTQIDINGNFIKDSHLFRKSYRVSRELEEKYNITKAVGHRSTIKNSIGDQIKSYLEDQKGQLLPVLDSIIQKALKNKPTSLKEFEYGLKQYQVIREQRSRTTEGHIFKLLPLDLLEEPNYHSKHSGIPGREIDTNYSLPAILKTIELNKKGKNQLLKNVQGRVYSIYNNISESIDLITFITALKKKGILLDIKRRQTGDRAGQINGYIFTDIKSNFKYTATELKIKSIELSEKLIDDKSDLNEDESIEEKLIHTLIDNVEIEAYENDEIEDSKYEVVEPYIDFDNIMDAFSQLFESHFAYPEDDTLLKAKKKRKKKRK